MDNMLQYNNPLVVGAQKKPTPDPIKLIDLQNEISGAKITVGVPLTKYDAEGNLVSGKEFVVSETGEKITKPSISQEFRLKNLLDEKYEYMGDGSDFYTAYIGEPGIKPVKQVPQEMQ
jgi:hypothetical protein